MCKQNTGHIKTSLEFYYYEENAVSTTLMEIKWTTMAIFRYHNINFKKHYATVIF